MAEPLELTSGHCHRCGGYGRGLYDGAINAWADAITDHVGCPDASVVAKEAPGLYAEGAGEGEDVVDADVVDAVLDSADRLVVDPGPFGELDLAQASSQTQST